uniref:glycosyltransferase family 2 protein n=1 Tax=Campylobacter concisus TaxID=199 RepID=UPI00112F95A9
MKDYNVSIIVPIYNVEKYIEKCAVTLFEQDYDNVEYVFVNDCSPDKSMKILKDIIEKYPNRKDDIKIINNIKNSGSSLTRKYGLDASTGKYILFVDSDDWVDRD